ncbi:MAG: IPT/TIG domain-containing protein [Polyangiaceae bacterium]|nr:IPT/TIG domain-containing protein [Polyangiaceae bacterium]MCW5791299.1 IPT/TIG domain-containing protein [Polyangiaceae bacterium]
MSDQPGGGPAPPPWVDPALREQLLPPEPAESAPPVSAPPASLPVSTPHPARIAAAPAPPPDPSAGPRLHAVTPALGPTSGGPPITITGYCFEPGIQVHFGESLATVIYEGPERLTAMLPPRSPAGRVDVRLTLPSGQEHRSMWAFEYLGPPLVAAVEPDHAPVVGGALLRVSGAGFQPGCLVQVGASSAQTRFISPELVEILAQPHPEGRFDVTVWNPDGQTGSLPQGFRYDGPPVITEVSPAEGASGVAHEIIVRGTGLEPRTTAALFGELALQVRFEREGALRLALPARASGAVDLTLYNPDGQRAVLREAFRYLEAEPPTLSTLSPTRHPLGAPLRLEVSGAGFQPGLALYLGQHPLELEAWASERLVAHHPGLPHVGQADLRVLNPDGQYAILPAALSVFDPEEEAARTAARVLTLTSVTPERGPASGGTQVKIRGLGFSHGTRVLIGGARPRAQRLIDETLIEVETDEMEPGPADVALRDEGALETTLPAGFHFEAVLAAVISRVTPNRGPAAGGHELSVEGEHFLPDTRALLGERAATVRYLSPTELTLITPSGTPGTLADLILIQPGGARSRRERIYRYE